MRPDSLHEYHYHVVFAKLSHRGRYRELVLQARQLEHEHGVELAPEDYGSPQDLKHALNLFRPVRDFMAEASRLERADLGGIIRRER